MRILPILGALATTSVLAAPAQNACTRLSVAGVRPGMTADEVRSVVPAEGVETEVTLPDGSRASMEDYALPDGMLHVEYDGPASRNATRVVLVRQPLRQTYESVTTLLHRAGEPISGRDELVRGLREPTIWIDRSCDMVLTYHRRETWFADEAATVLRLERLTDLPRESPANPVALDHVARAARAPSAAAPAAAPAQASAEPTSAAAVPPTQDAAEQVQAVAVPPTQAPAEPAPAVAAPPTQAPAEPTTAVAAPPPQAPTEPAPATQDPPEPTPTVAAPPKQAPAAPAVAAPTRAATITTKVPPASMPAAATAQAALNSPPRRSVFVAPVYPPRAKEQGVKGIVLLHVYVQKNGKVALARVTDAQPRGYGFAEAAVEAANRWKFIPARRNGRDVDGEIDVEVKFP